MREPTISISILGSSGGVARAVLALLNHTASDPTDPLYQILKQSTLHLIDLKQRKPDVYQQICPHLMDRIVLHQFDLRDIAKVMAHLKRTQTTLMIDVSWADTVEMLKCCNDLGVAYVNTALEIIEVDESEELEGFTLIERYQIFERNRHRFTNMKGILCSGMNPGVVQWMAHSLMMEPQDEPPLACYIVETDNTSYKDKTLLQEQTVYASWSPECFLDEAILNYPMFVQNHVPLFMYTPVYAQQFKVSLGDAQFMGCLMPHEEVLSLGKLHAMEFGFIYKVHDHMIQQLRANLDRPEVMWDWKHQVYDPDDADVEGEDLVGVLLVFKDKERYMYNAMTNQSVYAKYGVNATYFQVACGVYGALGTLLLDELPAGLYFVDELLQRTNSQYGMYVSQYMKPFIVGENDHSDGLLLDRIRPF